MSKDVSYHRRELETALDGSKLGHMMPTIEPRHKMILDVGCGMGQTLMAAGLSHDANAFGVDIDADAIAAGQDIAPSNIHLSVGGGEKLEFPDNFFDLVLCRVALPYMDVKAALTEMHRVLKPGGDIWLALHPSRHYARRFLSACRRGHYKDLVWCSYVLLNGMLFDASQKQLYLGGRTELYQSERGMVRAFAQAGFVDLKMERGKFFIAEASKPDEPRGGVNQL